METYNTLSDLLQGESPSRWGRSLYKYTDCGPWTVFVVADQPARTDRARVEVRVKEGRLVARCDNADALSFAGFEANGANRSRWTSLDAYYKRVVEFQNEKPEAFVHREWIVEHVARCIGCVRLDLRREVAATTKHVYYENAPDVIGNCVGILIGSIVEGSDVEVGEEMLTFPFTSEDLDKAVKRIDAEAAFYWKRDNTTYYTIRDIDGEVVHWCQWTEFADAPEADDEDLARKAHDVLFPPSETSWALNYGVDKPIPSTKLFVRLEDTPDITF